MAEKLAPLQLAELPARQTPFWKMTGPGAVLVGLSIGGGELVVWPLITAEFGASMVWAAALGIFIQLWVNFEIGRWTIATGESLYTGYSRLWRGFAHCFIFFNVAGWILPAWARTSGSALKALVVGYEHNSPDWLWTAITFAGVALVIFGPKKVYTAVERTIGILVVTVIAGLLVIAFKVGTRESVSDMVSGLANVGYIHPDCSVKTFFIALVFAGAGGTANLFYAFYLRDKQIGMGGRIPVLVNPFRNRQESRAQTGYIFSDDETSLRRFRDWFRFVLVDQTLYFWLLNTFTILLFIFGALAVLHPQGIIPQSGRLVWDEAAMLADTMGPFGRTLFLIIGLATLFSTQLALTDGVARSLADIFCTSFEFGKKRSNAGWYAGCVVAIIVIGITLTAIMEAFNITELGFLFNAAYVGGFAMAVFVPLTLWLNLKYLPKGARPNMLHTVMMVFASVIYLGFALYCIYYEVYRFLYGVE